MAIVKLNEITKAVERLFKDNLNGYIITRNAERNVDSNAAVLDSGWIGIYRGSCRYLPRSIAAGTSRRWTYELEIIVIIQAASMHSGEDAEDRLQTAEQEVVALLSNNPKLNDTVAMTTGYDIDYEYNTDNEVYFHASIVTIKAEVHA